MGLLRTVWLAIKMRIVWLVLTAVIITGAVLIFGPRSRKVDTLRRVLADRVLDEVIRDIERRIIQRVPELSVFLTGRARRIAPYVAPDIPPLEGGYLCSAFWTDKD